MQLSRPFRSLIVTILLLLTGGQATSAEIQVAVASNFADAIKAIANAFQAQTGHKVILIFGSTGKHYAQIRHGAPFDLFFAADSKRPARLEKEGVALPGSRFTYAIGRIVLWSPQEGLVDSAGKVLEKGRFRHLAVANPKLAPYGKAAQEVLRARGLWDRLQGRMVRGENIGQTFQFVKSGNAELGFVALSQVKRPGQTMKGSVWQVAESLYSPIEQQAVLLKDRDIARRFMQFVKSDESQAVIRGFGYGTP